VLVNNYQSFSHLYRLRIHDHDQLRGACQYTTNQSKRQLPLELTPDWPMAQRVEIYFPREYWERGKRSSTRGNACTAVETSLSTRIPFPRPRLPAFRSLAWLILDSIINGIILLCNGKIEFASPTTSKIYFLLLKKLIIIYSVCVISVAKFIVLFQNKVKLEFLTCSMRFHQFWSHVYLFYKNINVMRMFSTHSIYNNSEAKLFRERKEELLRKHYI